MATSSSGRWLTGDEQVFALNFLAPTSGNRDSWVVMEQQWLVRIHARLRKDYYHPVHDNNPVLTEQLSARRVTVIFEMDGHQWTWRTVQPDEWGLGRQPTHTKRWRGFTLFRSALGTELITKISCPAESEMVDVDNEAK